MKRSTECNYEWTSWDSKIPIQKYWKRKVGALTKEFLGSPDSILDVGCGSSRTIDQFRCRRLCVDGDSSKLDFLKSVTKVETRVLDLEKGLPLPKHSFDAVICNNVLEHLQNNRQLVADISKVLKRYGRAVLTVPDYSSPLTPFMEWIYGLLMPYSYAGSHVAKFRESTLDTLCRDNNLRLLRRKMVVTDMVCLYERY